MADMLDDMGATIMGRNMFGPIRGEWGDSDWKGWWGDEPPYHCPVFVLTHYPHDPIELDGGTTFHFVTDGIESAYAQARRPPVTAPISIAGGASCARQAIQAGSRRRDRPAGESGHPRVGRAPIRRFRAGAPELESCACSRLPEWLTCVTALFDSQLPGILTKPYEARRARVMSRYDEISRRRRPR